MLASHFHKRTFLMCFLELKPHHGLNKDVRRQADNCAAAASNGMRAGPLPLPRASACHAVFVTVTSASRATEQGSPQERQRSERRRSFLAVARGVRTLGQAPTRSPAKNTVYSSPKCSPKIHSLTAVQKQSNSSPKCTV